MQLKCFVEVDYEVHSCLCSIITGGILLHAHTHITTLVVSCLSRVVPIIISYPDIYIYDHNTYDFCGMS